MQHRPPGKAVGGELGALVVVEVEGVESLADGAAIPLMRGAPRGRFWDSINTTTAPCWSLVSATTYTPENSTPHRHRLWWVCSQVEGFVHRSVRLSVLLTPTHPPSSGRNHISCDQPRG